MPRSQLIDAPARRTRAPRRHLAANVVCLFGEERPVVSNPRRRGRLPKGVSRFMGGYYLKVGDIALLTDDRDFGKRVRIIEAIPTPDWGRGECGPWFHVELLSGKIDCVDQKGNHYYSAKFDVPAVDLWRAPMVKP